MSLTPEEVLKIAHLARLTISKEEISHYADKLSRIMAFIEQLQAVDTSQVPPLAHPLDLSQRFRPDVVTETDLHEKYQQTAPLVEAGLYLVPKVIDEA